MDFKAEIEKLLKKEVGDVKLEIPPDSSMGDYALPCFSLAAALKKNPVEIAKELAKKIKSKYIEKIEVKGPYLNFFVNKNILSSDTVAKILKEKERYGSSGIGKKEKMLIEHTSINPNASPHVGRARNALIGDSLTRLFRFQDYKVEVHYYVNDIGKQIAMLVLGAKDKITFDSLLDTYVQINKKIKANPRLEKDIFELLAKLEKGDKKVRSQFKKIVDICIKGQAKILSDLGIKYNFYDYESKYLFNKDTEEILERLRKTGRITRDEAGTILDLSDYGLEMRNPVLVLTRSDGTSLYSLRDIAYNIEKLKRCKNNLLVLGEDQKLYCQQIKAALDVLGYKAPRVLNYSYIMLQSGKSMSTRQGDVVLLEDFMREAKKKAMEELKKRKRANERTAEVIGYGALKYSILKVNPDKNVIFDWANALNFEGDSGPYIQYSHARACSILKKAKWKGNVKTELLKDEKEVNLVNSLSRFTEIALEATNNLRPQVIATYLNEVAKAFNEFYHECPVLKAEKSIKNARLALVDAARQVLKNGLYLLGIDAPERM